MMDRYRSIAGSPVRSATETWSAVANLAAATLARSPRIEAEAVLKEFAAAAGAASALIAGRYVHGDCLTILAGTMRLHIDIADGEAAFAAQDDENLEPVPGAATADSWAVYINPPEILRPPTETATSVLEHFHVGPAPADVGPAAPSAAFSIDLAALANMRTT